MINYTKLNDSQIQEIIRIGCWLVINFSQTHNPPDDVIKNCCSMLNEFIESLLQNRSIPPKGFLYLNKFISDNGGNAEFSDINELLESKHTQ
jgi:hypothetical protein